MNTSDLPQNHNTSTNKLRMKDGNSTSIAELSAQKSNITSSSDDFQDTFRLFGLRFEAFCFDHWIWLTVASTCSFTILILMYDVRFAQLYPKFGSFYNIKNLFTDWVNILAVVVLIMILLSFTAWRHKILSTFQMLRNKGLINSHNQVSDIAQQYRSFLNAYQSDLLSYKRYFVIAFPVIATFVFQLTVWSNPSRGDALLSIDAWLYVIFFILTSLFMSYFLGVAVWVMGVTGRYIRKLPEEFELTILPSHPDNCGGLKSLGNFCLSMAIPILIIAVSLGIGGIGSAIRHGVNSYNLLLDLFLVLIALPLAAIAFFVPLWKIHDKMIDRRDIDYDNFAERVAKLEKKIQSALDDRALDEAKSARDEMEIVQALPPGKIGYPTWPFDRSILIAFLAPQIIPIVSLIVQIIPWLLK